MTTWEQPMPRLSILLPTYNGTRYLDEQIKSILEQTSSDFEILAVDDGSTDETVDKLAFWSAQDTRMRVIPSAGNNGQVNRIAELLTHSSGELISIADQDDIWHPCRNEKLLDGIVGKDLAVGRSQLIDEAGEQNGLTLLDMLLTTPHAGKLEALLRPRYSAHGMIVRRSRFNPGTLGHPLPFDWLLGLENEYSGGVAYVDDAVVYHRIHGGNQMNNIKLGKRKIDGGYLRWLLLNRRGIKLRFWMVLQFIGRSSHIAHDVRKDFAYAADRCYSHWYSEWRGLRPGSEQLRKTLADAIEPHASSEQDLSFFREQADYLTGSIFSSANLREIRQRHQATAR